MRYNNYHKHTMYSNVRTLDSITKPAEYIARAKELGQTAYFTTEHGFQGNIFEAYTLCQESGMKCIYGVEAYYTDDITVEKERSKPSYHLMLVAMTENARKEINRILSVANTDGFYYKPRIGLNLLLSLPAKEVIVTTACIAGPMFKAMEYKKTSNIIGYKTVMKYDDNGDEVFERAPVFEVVAQDEDYWYQSFFVPVWQHFKENLYLEVQCHDDPKQISYNKKIMDLHRKTGIKIIHGNDSHYIHPEDAKNRDLFLRAKGVWYDDESGFCLDYPDSDEILRRYAKQGVLSPEEAIEALENTLVFDNAEGITLDKEFKIPKIIEGDSNKELKRLINEGWKKERGNVPQDRWPEYIEQIRYEYKIIEDCGMADYFILDHYIAKKAVNEYGAVMTRTGRGSAVSFYINKLLGLTEVDRIAAPITLYPTRFMSAERILQSRSLPDIDQNYKDVEPVIRASKDYLGNDGIYYMVSYKPLQDSSAFRLWCKSQGLKIKEYDDVAKDIDSYVDDPRWGKLIKDSKVFVGVIESISPSPCSFLLSAKPISSEVGLIKVGDVMCCCLDGYNCDVYKWLKNDYLTVLVYGLIDETYKLIGRPIDDIPTLLRNCDEKVWNVFADGMTTTVNQSDSDYDKQILMKYKPRNESELSAYVAAIRPGFAPLLNNFIERKPYTTGVKELDDILEDSYHYLMYQESIMKYLHWLGIEEKATYDIIKKISKKKFTEGELKDLKTKLQAGWSERVGRAEGFEETWAVVEAASSYSFNASHSYCVALDALYGAYLKSHYPLQYFSVAFDAYEGDMERTSNLSAEMPYFGISLKPIKFRHSGSRHMFDEREKTIYKSISSVKYCSKDLGDKLYAMRDREYSTFVDFLNESPCDARQLSILIHLGFFEEFGKTQKLLSISEQYKKYHDRKNIPKEKCDLSPEMLQRFCTKESPKQYQFADGAMDSMLRAMEATIEDKEIPLATRLKAEMENLGYIQTRVSGASNTAIILEIDCKYSPKVELFDLGSGEKFFAKISKQTYQNIPVSAGDVIVYRYIEKPKCHKDEKGRWVEDPTQFDRWLEFYGVTGQYA